LVFGFGGYRMEPGLGYTLFATPRVNSCCP
jgi:hypothetical protein